MNFSLIPQGKLLVLYDGNCALCQSSVQWILNRDTKCFFVFASLESEIGEEFSGQQSARDKSEAIGSLILVDNHRIYRRSTASLKIAQRLGYPYAFLSLFLVVPHVIRDAVYNLVAVNRYRWFGQRCWVRQEKWESRFLD